MFNAIRDDDRKITQGGREKERESRNREGRKNTEKKGRS